MEKRSRLGRGLSSLLDANRTVPADSIRPVMLEVGIADLIEHNGMSEATKMFHVEHSKVVANPNQPRKQFDEASLVALAQSIKIAGVIQPIVVRVIGDHFEVIAGERRWRAAKLAGLAQVPIVVRTAAEIEQAQLALIENIHRDDLNPIDRACAYDAMMKTGLTQLELSEKLGEDRSVIGNHLRLLNLPDTVRQLVANGVISLGHAKLLCGIDDVGIAEKIASRVVEQGWSVRQLETALKRPVGDSGSTLVKPTENHRRDLERQISRDLQMRTEVKQAKKGGSGRLVIHYASLDQFDDLLTRLAITLED